MFTLMVSKPTPQCLPLPPPSSERNSISSVTLLSKLSYLSRPFFTSCTINMRESGDSANNGASEVDLYSFDGREDGGDNGVHLVEISDIFRAQRDFLTERHHLTEY